MHFLLAPHNRPLIRGLRAAVVAARLTRKGNPMQAYTKSIRVIGEGYELSLLVEPDADLDGEFTALDAECGDTLVVCGWLADEIIE